MRNQKKALSKNQNLSQINLIFTCLGLVIAYFNTSLQDPFNSPKMWILMVVACWLSGHLLTSQKGILNNLYLKLFSVALMFFVFFMLLSLIFTNDKYTGFDRSLNDEGYVYNDDIGTTNCYLYEADIPPLLKFFHKKQINPSGWIKIPSNK